MSYCRFSSDNFACDVYCYEAEDGFVTHVARTRIVGDIPKTPARALENVDTYMVAHRAQMAFMETCVRVPISLPHDGDSFSDDDAGACADRLESLRVLGYNVPQYAIDALREESIKDQHD